MHPALSLLLPALITLPLAAGEVQLPEDAGSIMVPAGWTATSATALVLRGPGQHAMEAPRLALTTADGDVDGTTAALRDGYRRLADGCEILDDDQVPLGGRVWRRIRVRFAAGPLEFGQSAWIGSVGKRTVVAILSAPDDRIAGHLAAAVAAVASISVPR